MTKEQWITLAVAGVGAVALLVAAVQPPREPTEQEKREALNAEAAIFRAENDKRSGYQRQLRQGAITCDEKNGFLSLAAYTSITEETIKDFYCQRWRWPMLFQTDPSQADDYFIRVRLPNEKGWQWALKSSIVTLQ